MDMSSYIRADVLHARRQGLVMCPCGATYGKILKRCPQCGRPNLEKFK